DDGQGALVHGSFAGTSRISQSTKVVLRRRLGAMRTPISRAELLAIERAAVTAWPALETADIDGWLWRYSGGGSPRATSVSPLSVGGPAVGGARAPAGARCRPRGPPPMCQICRVNVPAALDRRLQQRGYRLQGPCTCLAKRIDPAGAGLDAHVEFAQA